MVLTPEQILLVGLIASAVTQVLKVLSTQFGLNLGDNARKGILYAVGVVLSFLWARPELNFGGDPAQFAIDLIAAAAAVVGFARFIYELLLEKTVFPMVRLAPRK